jgi:CheY-like chemotaxis protein
MDKNGPVIVIEDDLDDQYMLEIVFKKLGYPNKIIYFPDGQQALDYLLTTEEMPFLILSDINMPKLDGFELRNKIHVDAQLQIKCIPYLFFSTAIDQDMVIKAYSLSAQGFFIKPDSIAVLEETISIMMEYWKRCAAPNNFPR